MSQIKFEEGNTVGLDLHFGCNLDISHEPEDDKPKNDWDFFMSLMRDIHPGETGNGYWFTNRSIFTSVYTKITFDFSDEAK
jgi:hypothetical protein